MKYITFSQLDLGVKILLLTCALFAKDVTLESALLLPLET